MNQTEIERLVHAVNALRPDWPTGSLRTFVTSELRARPFRDAVVAMAWVACDPETRTPRRVLEAGPWWTATTTAEASSGPRPIAFADLCHHCGSVPQRCRSELVQSTDPHPYRTAQDAAAEQARADRRSRAASASDSGWSPTSALDPGRPSPTRRAELRAGLEAGRAAQAARQAELDQRYLARLGAAGPGPGQPDLDPADEHDARDPGPASGVRDDEVPDPGESGEQAADEVV